MEKVIIDLREFGTLKNNLHLEGVETDENGFTDYDRIVGTLTVSQEELGEVLGEELKYQIEELGNLMVEWDFQYEGLEIDNCTGFEIIKISKFQDGKVYFKVV